MDQLMLISIYQKWTTRDGFTYTNWADGEPNNWNDRGEGQGSAMGWDETGIPVPRCKIPGWDRDRDEFSGISGIRDGTGMSSHPVPVPTPGEDCVSMYVQNGKWNDDICDQQYNFICYKRAYMTNCRNV